MNTLPRHALWIVLLLGFLAPRVKSAERFDLPPGEAIQYMLEHNRDYQKQLADREDARQNVRQTSGEALPNLTSELSWTRIGNISEFSFDPDGSGPESAAVLKAAAADNYAGKLSLQQPLFNAAVFQAIGVSRSYSRVAEQGLNAARQTLVQSFLEQYAQVILLRDLVDLNQQIVEQTKAHFDEATLLDQMGSLSRYDLLRSEVEYLNSIPALREAEKNLSTAENALRITLGLDPEAELVLHKFNVVVDLATDPQSLEEMAARNRPEILLAENAVEGYRRGVNVYRADQWPVLNAFANAERSNVWDLFSQNDSWQNSWNAGVSLSVPLFSGFRKDAQVQKGKLSLLRARADLALTRDQVRLQTRAAMDELQRSQADLTAWQRNVEAAEEGLRIASLRNESGSGSGLELRDARTARKLAGVNLATAEYKLRVAQVNLLHAVGDIDRIRIDIAEGDE